MSISTTREDSHVNNRELPSTLFAICALAFIGFWVVTPVLFQLVTGTKLLTSTQPATQQAAEMPARALVQLSIAAPLAGLLTLIVANLLLRRNAFDRLGLTFSHLLHRGWSGGLLAAAFVLPATFGAVLLTEKFWTFIHFAHPNEHDLLRVLGEEPNAGIKIAIVLSAIVLAPLFEEFFFRGMLQSACRMIMPTWAAILVASILFAAVHGAVWLAPPIFFLSLCLGLAYELSGNLWVSIIVHAAFNAASVSMFLISR